MHRKIFISALLAACALICCIFGAYVEAVGIQQTCESDSAATVINGTQYLCLSQRQIDNMRRQHEQRGV